jgi:hypothetical protein
MNWIQLGAAVTDIVRRKGIEMGWVREKDSGSESETHLTKRDGNIGRIVARRSMDIERL